MFTKNYILAWLLKFWKILSNSNEGAGPEFLKSLTKLVSVIANNMVPEKIRPLLSSINRVKW